MPARAAPQRHLTKRHALRVSAGVRQLRVVVLLVVVVIIVIVIIIF